MGYRFKSDSEHTRLVKMVNTTVSKSVPMGYRFESDSEYLNVWIEKKGFHMGVRDSANIYIIYLFLLLVLLQPSGRVHWTQSMVYDMNEKKGIWSNMALNYIHMRWDLFNLVL